MTNPKYDYRVLTALRGPDDDKSPVARELKRLLTARIRAIVFKRDECRGNYQNEPFSSDDFVALSRLARRKPSKHLRHCIYHLVDALRVTFNHKVWGEHGGDILRLLDTWVYGNGQR